MPSPPALVEFTVRPGLDAAARPLIEFGGDHRAPDFPPVLLALRDHLPGFAADAACPAHDEVVWQCSFDGGTFELADDWAGLFILARADADRVIETVADALVRSGRFLRRWPVDVERSTAGAGEPTSR